MVDILKQHKLVGRQPTKGTELGFCNWTAIFCYLQASSFTVGSRPQIGC